MSGIQHMIQGQNAYPTGAPGPCSLFLVEFVLLIYFQFSVCFFQFLSVTPCFWSSPCYSFTFSFLCFFSFSVLLLVFGRVRVTHLLLVFCVFQFLRVTPCFWSSPCYSFTFSFLCFSVSQCYSQFLVESVLLIYFQFSVCFSFSVLLLVFGRVLVTHLLLVFCVFQFLSVTPSFWSSPCYSFTFRGTTHPSKPHEFIPCFKWGSCYSIFSFMCMFCGSLFVLLFFFSWQLCCLFFFDLRIVITSLVLSNSS